MFRKRFKGFRRVLKIIKEEIVDKFPGFSEAINKLKTGYKKLMEEKGDKIKKHKEIKIAKRVVNNTPDGVEEEEDDEEEKENHKVRNIIIIVALAIVVLGIVGLVVYYLLSRGGGNQQKQNSNGSGNTNEGVKPDKDKENDMNQTQNSDSAQPDSQKSNRTGLVVKAVMGSTGVVGAVGGSIAYGVNGSRSNSVEKNKKDEKSGAKVSQNPEKAKANENLENAKTSEEKNEEKKKK